MEVRKKIALYLRIFVLFKKEEGHRSGGKEEINRTRVWRNKKRKKNEKEAKNKKV